MVIWSCCPPILTRIPIPSRLLSEPTSKTLQIGIAGYDRKKAHHGDCLVEHRPAKGELTVRFTSGGSLCWACRSWAAVASPAAGSSEASGD